MPKTRVAIAGCGNVSEAYLSNLMKSPFVQVTGVCDVSPDRAAKRAEQFGVPYAAEGIDRLLRDVDFDLLINLTAMPSHYPVNLKALEAGRHVLCEKPIAASVEEGLKLLSTAQEKGVKLFGAPNVVTSPAFRCLAEIVQSGEIGKVHAAHGRYGSQGPSWGPWFYRKGGGSLFDLGVYNVTTLTGLLGPVRSVTALTGIARPEREIEGEHVKVEADDNTMLLMDHGDAVFSSVQTGFVYGDYRNDWTVELIGTEGAAYLLGWDWGPKGVEVRTSGQTQLRSEDQGDYCWQGGGATIAECLATGRTSLMTGERAMHVLEIMLGALESGKTGRRVQVESSFPWPIRFS
jgi:predicted dehydrogenase